MSKRDAVDSIGPMGTNTYKVFPAFRAFAQAGSEFQPCGHKHRTIDAARRCLRHKDRWLQGLIPLVVGVQGLRVSPNGRNWENIFGRRDAP